LQAFSSIYKGPLEAAW
jgi:hypothetical protein